MPPASFMAFVIMGAPMPAKFILERPSFLVPFGIILPNIACSVLLPLVSTFSGLRRMLRPQNVAKMVTSSPMAAAPLAMMNAAMTLSKSPLNRMIVFLVSVDGASASATAGVASTSTFGIVVASIRTPLGGRARTGSSPRRRLP